LQHLIVPESQHTKSLVPEIAVAHPVIAIIRVLTTIDLDHQLSSETRKVDYIGSYRNLPLELLAVETMSAQPIP